MFEKKPRKVAIIQSNYIPWKGYFDIINDVDLFIFHDDIQYTKNDWRNRNKIKVPDGLKWLTVPVGSNTDRLINQVKITTNDWQVSHLKTIHQYYSRTKYYDLYMGLLNDIYSNITWTNLSHLNQFIIKKIARDYLGIKTSFLDSSSLGVGGYKLDKVLNLLIEVNADVYVSGPAAKTYIDEQEFNRRGIELVYKDYTNYPIYQQNDGTFEHGVTILDLLFNTGPNAPYYIWGWREGF